MQYLKTATGITFAVLENGILKRRCKSSKHFLRQPPSICLDAQAYDAARPHFHTLEITDLDTGCVYTVSASVFDAKKFEIQRGFGRQYALPLRYWHCHNPNAQTEQLALL